MDRMVVLFFSMLSLMAMVALGGVYAEYIVGILHRRVPNFSYEGELFFLWGLAILAAFGLGLMVMYLLLRP